MQEKLNNLDFLFGELIKINEAENSILLLTQKRNDIMKQLPDVQNKKQLTNFYQKFN